MHRPSPIAAPARQRRSGGARWRGRSVLSLSLLALVLAFAHVWENVSVAELRARIDRARGQQEQLGARLRQLTAQLAQWRAQAEASPGASTRLGFVIPQAQQVRLISVGTLASTGGLLATAPAPRSLWDWLAASAEAESRGPASAAAPGSEADALP
ncbi:MAG TPA: hypothetical protein VMS93_06645 [Candidatus Saccharimonadales bacterium]|nr:hypothetical protein [Candidatus Saccharimonadales bacterium]